MNGKINLNGWKCKRLNNKGKINQKIKPLKNLIARRCM